MLCICMGTIYLKLDNSWLDTYSRASMLFFIVAFLTFMSIAGFPAFVEDMVSWAWWRYSNFEIRCLNSEIRYLNSSWASACAYCG